MCCRQHNMAHNWHVAAAAVAARLYYGASTVMASRSAKSSIELFERMRWSALGGIARNWLFRILWSRVFYVFWLLFTGDIYYYVTEICSRSRSVVRKSIESCNMIISNSTMIQFLFLFLQQTLQTQYIQLSRRHAVVQFRCHHSTIPCAIVLSSLFAHCLDVWSVGIQSGVFKCA